MVNHYVRTAQKTADYHIMVDMHEPCAHRPAPHLPQLAGLRGRPRQRVQRLQQGNPPEHETILPFTRLMGGPMDYTPGIFKIQGFSASVPSRQVHTTLCKQLALYVTLYSPLQMAADLPENYNRHLDAFQSIEDVPVDWDDTRILAAEPGDYLATVRKAKGRDEWYLGAITDENVRKQSLSWTFSRPACATRPRFTPMARAPAGIKTPLPTAFPGRWSTASRP